MAFDLSDLLKDVPKLGTYREQIEYIKLDLIDEDPNNFYQLSGIEELAANIELFGLQQPIRVRKQENGRYMIVSGHRRRAALEVLAKDDPEKWQEAGCIVEQNAASPSLQQLRLIYANAHTRKLTPVEVSKQAEEVEKLLYQLKEEGYDFPGRMRDHVAEAVGASKSKLARLKVIRENLDASWVDAFEDGSLTESQAYELAQMPKFWQSLIKDNWGFSIQSLHANSISKIRTRFKNVVEIKCQHGLQLCEHSVTMMEKNARDPAVAPCSRCCFECSSLLSCKKCCPEAVAKKKEMKAVEKQAQREADERQAERDRPGAEFAKLVYERVGLARKKKRVSVEELFRVQKKIYSSSIDDPKQKAMECGKGKYSSGTYMPFGYSMQAESLMKVRDVADALDCSVDYLLGRTDRMDIVPESDQTDHVSEPGTIWHPISEEPPTGVDLVWLDAQGYSDTGIYLGGQRIESVCTIRWEEAQWWATLPKRE